MTDKGTERKLNITFAQLAPLPGFNLVKYLLVSQSLCVGGGCGGGVGGVGLLCIWCGKGGENLSLPPGDTECEAFLTLPQSNNQRRDENRGLARVHACIHTHTCTYIYTQSTVCGDKKERGHSVLLLILHFPQSYEHSTLPSPSFFTHNDFL